MVGTRAMIVFLLGLLEDQPTSGQFRMVRGSSLQRFAGKVG